MLFPFVFKTDFNGVHKKWIPVNLMLSFFHRDTFVIDGLLVFLVSKDALLLFFLSRFLKLYLYILVVFDCEKLFSTSEKSIYRLSNDVYKILPESLNKNI